VSDDLSRYICASVWQMVQDRTRILRRPLPVYLSKAFTCSECRARVHFVGEHRFDGAWHCPVCGASYPYVFWKAKCEAYRPVAIDELVISLGEGACTTCGEANPPCRCERREAGRVEATSEVGARSSPR
jgi:hypothetical protein